MYDSRRVDSEQVAVICEVMDCAERDSIDDGRGPIPIAIVDDVRRLQKCRLPQATDRATRRVRAEHGDPESMLVEADQRLARRVPSYVIVGHDAFGRCISERKASLELDEPGLLVNRDHERWSHNGVLPGGDATEVDERYRELVRGYQSAIVGGGLKSCGG